MKKLAAKLGVQAVPLLTLTLIAHSLGNIVLEDALATSASAAVRHGRVELVGDGERGSRAFSANVYVGEPR